MSSYKLMPGDFTICNAYKVNSCPQIFKYTKELGDELEFVCLNPGSTESGRINMRERTRVSCCRLLCNIKDIPEEQKPYLEALKSSDKETVLFAIEVLKNLNKKTKI